MFVQILPQRLYIYLFSRIDDGSLLRGARPPRENNGREPRAQRKQVGATQEQIAQSDNSR